MTGRAHVRRFHQLPEKFRVLLVGVWNTVFGLLTFAVLHAVVGDRGNFTVVLILNYFIGTGNAFIGYRRGVFRVRGNLVVDYLRFSSVYLFGLAANAVLLPLLVKGAGLNVLVAQTLISGGLLVSTYLLHKYFSFRRPAEPKVTLSAQEGPDAPGGSAS